MCDIINRLSDEINDPLLLHISDAEMVINNFFDMIFDNDISDMKRDIGFEISITEEVDLIKSQNENTLRDMDQEIDLLSSMSDIFINDKWECEDILDNLSQFIETGLVNFCEHCLSIGNPEPGPGYRRRPRTSYYWDGTGENPNAPLFLCDDCADDYNDYWDEMWRDYYGHLLY